MSWRRSVIDLVQPEEVPIGPDYRKRVEWLMILRMVVTTLLLAATIFFHLEGGTKTLIDSAVVPLYVLISATFLLSLLYAVATPRITNLYGFSFFQVFVDVVYCTVLVYFTGGASSAFTPIYIFPIISSGILHFRRGAFWTASSASVFFGLILNLEYHGFLQPSDWPWTFEWGSRTSGYILWLMVVHFTVFFLAALMASSLAEQLHRTKVSLSRSEKDYWNLSELHTSIVHSIPSGIMTSDDSDTITFVNTAGAQLLSSSQSKLMDRQLPDVFPEFRERLAPSASRRDTYATVRQIGADTVHLQLTVSDLTDKQGQPTGRLVVFSDVTQIKKMEERVKRSEELSAFVRIAAGMAHEIRNPLAILRGATELLSQSEAEVGDQNKLHGIILRESDRINSLLADFLQTVRVRRADKVRVMLDDVVQETVDMFSKSPQLRNGISIETLVGQGLEIEGDAKTLRRALWNLLSNACDASSEGGVVKVILEADQEEGQACLKVQDLGHGIPPDMKKRIFEPFATSKEGGTGLGLPLVLSAVEAHNGTIEVESDPSSGTVFTVRIPLASAETSDDKRRDC